MKFDLYGIIRLVLLILIVLTVAFIFIQSTYPPQESSEKSEEVGDIIAEIIPPETPVGEYVQNNVRKLAHFFEFLALGLWVSLYVSFSFTDPALYFGALFSGLLVALLDETIQIFSSRGASVADVWLDFLGYTCSTVIIYTVCTVWRLIRRKRKQK